MGWGWVAGLVRSQVSAKFLWRPDFLHIQVTRAPLISSLESLHSLQSLGAISGVFLISRSRGRSRIWGSEYRAIGVQ